MPPTPIPSLLETTAAPHGDDAAVPTTDDPSQPRPRQCGRCRLMFPGDPTLHQAGLPDWWLCSPCRAALLGGPRRAPSADTRPATVPKPVPRGCWYRDPAHRPSLGWCPSDCHGPVSHAERLGNGDQHVYCEAHAHWRRQTIQLPTLVRRMPSGEQPEEPRTIDDGRQVTG